MESNLHHQYLWSDSLKPNLLIRPLNALSHASVATSNVLPSFVFTSAVGYGYAHLDHELHSMSETIEHRILRSRKYKSIEVLEFPFTPRPVKTISCVWTTMPRLLSLSTLKVRQCLFLFNFPLM